MWQSVDGSGFPKPRKLGSEVWLGYLVYNNIHSTGVVFFGVSRGEPRGFPRNREIRLRDGRPEGTVGGNVRILRGGMGGDARPPRSLDFGFT